ncbi:ABC-2 family transporter protein [Novipirellula aureliae]|uniref:ABC-2 family transporter protein n=2 Tax=Novipirellula aureliae TaxID=2527966 RepID=A0A5C6DUE7_9BACT|nr:ABC-2 family transporter protein [Novipirellula aureliae]
MINVVHLRKELRQLTPLLIVVAVLGLLCFALIEMRPMSWGMEMMSSGYVLIGIPALFAVGAGPISISQEKETRSLAWLCSLPLAKDRLVKTKFIAAFLGWIGLWVFTLLCSFFFESMGWRLFPSYAPDSNPLKTTWLVYWVLNSFYLLVIGFLTAWKFENSMTSLLAFVPLAVIPAFLRFGIAYLQDPYYNYGNSRYDETLPQCLVSVGVSLSVAILAMNRVARQTLAPESSRLSPNPYHIFEGASDASIQTSQSVLRPSSAMLWQFFHQNKKAYLSLLSASVLVGLLALYSAGWHGSSGNFVFPILVVTLATSWIGVLVFQSDNHRDRIRYFAEHGVSPRTTWLTRQLLPFGFVCLANLFYLFVLARYINANPSEDQLPLWLAFWFLAFIYGYSQWFAQLVRNPVLSVIGSPIVAYMALGYVFFTLFSVSSRILYIVILTVVPFIATWWMMRRWMDRRFGRRFWCFHAALLLFAITLPIGDLTWFVLNSPDMPDDVKVALRKEGSQIGESPNHYDPFRFNRSLDEPNTVVNPTVERRLELAEQQSDTQDKIDRLQQIMSGSGYQGIRLGEYEVQQLIGNLYLSRTRLEMNPLDQSALDDYQSKLQLMWLAARAARRSVNLKSQEAADFVEIAIIAELQRPETKKSLNENDFDQYVNFVADTESRNKSRRRAIVATWCQFDRRAEDDRSLDSIGDYYIENPLETTLKRLFTNRSRVNHLAWVLLQFLELGPELSEDQKVELLRDRLPYFPDSVLKNYFGFLPRIDDPSETVLYSFGSGLPGNQWFAGWEQAGVDLKQLSTRSMSP